MHIIKDGYSTPHHTHTKDSPRRTISMGQGPSVSTAQHLVRIHMDSKHKNTATTGLRVCSHTPSKRGSEQASEILEGQDSRCIKKGVENNHQNGQEMSVGVPTSRQESITALHLFCTDPIHVMHTHPTLQAHQEQYTRVRGRWCGILEQGKCVTT